MGLDQVITDVREDGQTRAQQVVAAARQEADSILAAAREKAQAHEKARAAEAERDAEQVLAQARSRARSEARKVVLQTEAALRQRLRAAVLDALAGLDAATRRTHMERLLSRAQEIVPSGRLWCAAVDEDAAAAQSTYETAGTADIHGGVIVESQDGTARLDLSYETLLAGLWRDVLRSEAKLFA